MAPLKPILRTKHYNDINCMLSKVTRGQAGEEERPTLTINGIEEARIRQELGDAQESGNKERMEKAWENYMLLWKQKSLIR